jgi:hypothetical protein
MQTKLFLGTRLTPDLKMRLLEISDLKWLLIPYEGKEYLGQYLKMPFPTIQGLREQCDEFIESLQECLPDLRTDTLPIVVFPQLFLG